MAGGKGGRVRGARKGERPMGTSGEMRGKGERVAPQPTTTTVYIFEFYRHRRHRERRKPNYLDKFWATLATEALQGDYYPVGNWKFLSGETKQPTKLLNEASRGLISSLI